jgi:hypothetical protein
MIFAEKISVTNTRGLGVEVAICHHLPDRQEAPPRS